MTIALNILCKRSVMRSTHFIRTIFGMPSGPGALYGLSFLSCCATCSLVIGSSLQHRFGYALSGGMSVSAGLAGKKLFARAHAFSELVEVISSLLPCVCFSTGILAFAPSDAGAEMTLWTVHISRSVAFSNQSLQCCLLVHSSVRS